MLLGLLKMKQRDKNLQIFSILILKEMFKLDIVKVLTISHIIYYKNLKKRKCFGLFVIYLKLFYLLIIIIIYLEFYAMIK